MIRIRMRFAGQDLRGDDPGGNDGYGLDLLDFDPGHGQFVTQGRVIAVEFDVIGKPFFGNIHFASLSYRKIKTA